MLRITTQLAKVSFALTYKTLAATSNDFKRGCLPTTTEVKNAVGSYVYIPKNHGKEYLTEEEVNQEAKAIFQWAKQKGAQRYSFMCAPHTGGVFEKHDSFLNISYSHQEKAFEDLVTQEFNGINLIRNQADGSSVPSGGLRHTHVARAYTLWDHSSHIYVRRSNKTLYIPSILVTHYGKALGDKTLFKLSEKALQKSASALLNKLGVQHQACKMFLGLEQEFFVISKDAFDKREDLRWTNRALVGTVPARNQQLSQHYYGKIPTKIEIALEEAEAELLQLGVPFKTRHNEVALNQFEIACIFNDAGITIDQNYLLMGVLKETFQRHGLVVLFHEKPFVEINGSGKHANWSLNYFKKDGNQKNLFKHSDNDSAKDKQAYKLFILIQLMAALKHHKLYLAAIAIPGNEIRLGGHQAPPRIFSVFLGTTLSNMLDGKQTPQVENLKDLVGTLCFDANQQNSDRNRSSPFAYTGRLFEFRALGSSQNAAFPMAVIAATMTEEVNQVIKLLDEGKSVDEIIAQYVKETQKIRFEGNGYSKEWKEKATKRDLHVNEKFIDLYNFLDTEQAVFTRIGVSSDEEIKARSDIYKKNYMGEVLIEVDTLIYIVRRHLIPHALQYLHTTTNHQNLSVDKFSKRVKDALESVINSVNKLEENQKTKADSLSGCQELRLEMIQASQQVNTLMGLLPNNPNFPDQSQFLNL